MSETVKRRHFKIQKIVMLYIFYVSRALMNDVDTRGGRKLMFKPYLNSKLSNNRVQTIIYHKRTIQRNK